MINENVEMEVDQATIDAYAVFANGSNEDDPESTDEKDLDIEIGFKTCMVKLDHNTGSDDFMDFLHLIEECDDNDENLVGDLNKLI